VLSNVRLDRGEVRVDDGKKSHATGLRKFGAVIGDHAEIGCNSVINPGSVIGRRSVVYPLSSFSGVLPAESILKTRQQQVVVPRA
jgi:acetyltransferase-like isoleucine patch superfamily enzyme